MQSVIRYKGVIQHTRNQTVMFQYKQSYEWYSRAPQNYIHDVNFKRSERSRMERGGGGGGRDRAEYTLHNMRQAQGVVEGTTDVWTVCMRGRREECGDWRLDTAGQANCLPNT